MLHSRQMLRLKQNFFSSRLLKNGRWITNKRCLPNQYKVMSSGACSRRHFASGEEEPKPSPFPWRHNQYVLPRVELELLSQKRDGWKSKLAYQAWEKGTMVLMSKPFFEIIDSSCRQNLADEFAWSFTAGLAELLSNTYKVPIDDILIGSGDDIEINFEYTTPYSNRGSSEKESDSAKDPAKDEEDIIFENEYQLLHKKFYDKSHTKQETTVDTNPLEIKLSLKPITSDLVKLCSFPFLSRDAVKEKPSRRKDYVKIIPVVNQGQKFADTYRKMLAFADQLIAERGLMQTTIIADVLVVCMETFHVKDLETGELLQGHPTEQTVPHVLRMEKDVVLDVVKDENEWFQSNWRIADVDDTVGERDWWTPKF